jgi:hypothetical protein
LDPGALWVILGSSTKDEGSFHGEAGASMDISHTCEDCHRTVTDGAFLRSVNLRTVAWCRECWFAKRTDLIPQQRQPSQSERPSRWRLARR